MAGAVLGFALQYGVAGCADFNDAAAPEQDLPAANARQYRAQAVKLVMKSASETTDGARFEMLNIDSVD